MITVKSMNTTLYGSENMNLFYKNGKYTVKLIGEIILFKKQNSKF